MKPQPTSKMNPTQNPAETQEIVRVFIQHWPIFLFLALQMTAAIVVIVFHD
jgi:hypothetical protein